MTELDEQTVNGAGGWDGRFAVVRAVRNLGDRAAAVIASKGDGADINLERFTWVDGQRRLSASSGGAGEWGRGWDDGVWAEHDQDDRGWWLTLQAGAADADPGALGPDGSC